MLKKNQEIKRWFVFCDYCSHRKILEEEEISLTEIKRSDISGGLPELDPVTKKLNIKPAKSQPRMVKCPHCGRGTTIKPLPPAYSDVFQDIDEANRKEAEELEKLKRIEDGRPIPIDREGFLG